MSEQELYKHQSRLTQEQKEDFKSSKQGIQDLKKKKHQLTLDYLEKRNALIDKNKEDLKDLEDEYKYEKMKISSPLKAERYLLKAKKRKAYRVINDAPRRSILEEVGNAVSHGIGAIIGIICLVLMVRKANTPLSMAASIIYGSCFFLQMLISCLYHSFRGGSKVKRIFRRFDYSSIYLAIGGTFAPLYLIYMVTNMGWGLTYGLFFFILQWALIILGITFVCIFGPGRYRGLHFTLYFAIGWSALMFFPFWIRNDLKLLFWILLGGVVYTLGMIPFAALRKKKCAHFIWHIVVLTGAILMWIGIYKYVIC